MDEHGTRRQPAELPLLGVPPQSFYDDLYRRARSQLRLPRGDLSKHLRKYWQKQLRTARACLETYFGAEPPAGDAP